MNRLAAVACCALLFSCAKEPELEQGTTGTLPPPTSSAGGGGGSSGFDGGTDAGTDAGSADAGQRAPCSPTSNPSTCAAGEHCACGDPAGTGSDCFCYTGERGDPCAAGNNWCKAPLTCRWVSTQSWGRCGSASGEVGDVCDPSFFCATGLTCVGFRCQ